MAINQIIILISTVFIFSACDVSIKPINYNEDQCAYCKMMISDARFGAELVTDKGKVFKYDATECLLRELIDNGNSQFKIKAVTHVGEPNKLALAEESYFLVSENLPSPMGGNLSAYPTKEAAETAMNQNGGKVYSFEEIFKQYYTTYSE